MNKFTLSVTAHAILTVVVWLYAMVTVLGELGWWKWAKERMDKRGKVFNGFVFVVLLALAVSAMSVWYYNGKSDSAASLAYASSFY